MKKLSTLCLAIMSLSNLCAQSAYEGGPGDGFAQETLLAVNPAVGLEVGNVPQAELKLFPNPAISGSIIRINLPPGSELVQIYDSMGRELNALSFSSSLKMVTWQLPEMPAGIYTIRCGPYHSRLTVH